MAAPQSFRSLTAGTIQHRNMRSMSFPLANVDLKLEADWEDGDRIFGRCRRFHADALVSQTLAVWPAGDHSAPATLTRLAHEFGLRDTLHGSWAARPLELLREGGNTVLLLEDPGGSPLSGLIGRPMVIGQFLTIAMAIAAAVGGLHQRGLIHKDLKPSHILVADSHRHAWLLGFGIASPIPREPQSYSSLTEIAGTLAYMAPEQTGRMNRSIDTRSDLYALGIVFYQMLTGELPLQASATLDWVHSHLARQPVPPADRLASIPPVVSALVMKLLAKPAEERYQTAAGLEADLRRCLHAWEARQHVDMFALGEHDLSDTLVIPEHLYGREREIRRLVAAFDRVAAGGGMEVALVSGYSGVGKTTIVHELQRATMHRRGMFAAATADQHGERIPFGALAHAVRGLVRSLLGKDESELAEWRRALAMGPYTALLLPLIPELQQLLGPLPAPGETPQREASHRIALAFGGVIRVFAQPAHPLTLFLDNLQWLDAATLDLLQRLVRQSEIRHLLLVGTYRSNEVAPGSAWEATAESIRRSGAAVENIELEGLDAASMSQLLADTLHVAAPISAPLARLVHEKTAGNPFFAISFITELAEEGLLHFDHGRARWAWDLAQIQAKDYTDNVVELMLGKLGRLPPATQQVIMHLACLGNDASFANLQMAWRGEAETLQSALWDAARTGLVIRGESAYRFRHDKIREAAYALIPEDARLHMHLAIGWRLARKTPPSELAPNIFAVVGQLNRAVDLIDAAAERERLAELNLLAGQQAKGVSAYAIALDYLIAAAALLPPVAAESQQALAFAIDFGRAECEFMTGQSDLAQQRLRALVQRAESLPALAKVTQLQLELLLTGGQRQQAVEVGLAYLRRTGIDWTARPGADDVRRERTRMWQQLGTRPIEALGSLPPMSDAQACGTMGVLSALMQPAWYTDDNLRAMVILRMVNMSLDYGNDDASCVGYAWLSMILSAQGGTYDEGLRFGRMAMELAEQRGLDRFRARVYQIVGGNVLHWTQPIRNARSVLRRALDVTEKLRDFTYASYIYSNVVTQSLAGGDPLDQLQGEVEAGNVRSWGARYGLVADRIAPQLQLIRTLRGLTPSFGSFDDDSFDEAAFEQRVAGDVGLSLAACWYWIRKLQARYLAGDHAAALQAAERANVLLWTSPSYFEQAEYQFFAALARAASCEQACEGDLTYHLHALAAHRRQLEEWAGNCPSTFGNRAALVAAEVARIEGRDIDAMREYDLAIASARDNDLPHVQALAAELAGRFYLGRGMERVARSYLQDARAGYLHWGALGKVWQLDAQYAGLLRAERAASSAGTIDTPLQLLDLATVIAISQAVSGEIRLDRLIEILMRTAMEQAGASRGVLILQDKTDRHVAAEATIQGNAIAVQLRNCALSEHDLPVSVIHHVLRAAEHIVLDDAVAQRPYSTDPYLRQRRARSILCLPLLNQAKLIGALYLENDLATRLFVPARTEVLKFLASQAATALENSRLYRESQRADEALRQAGAELAHVSRVMTLTTLTASIAHEVSQPLAAMAINANAALRWLKRPEPDLREVESSLHEIVAAGERATSVIAGMRAMLRKADVVVAPLSINAVIRDTVTLIAGELARHDIALHLALHDALPDVAGDKVQLQQVILNLVMNGIEALKDVVAQPRELWIESSSLSSSSTSSASDGVTVAVRDAGPGFSPEDAERLFEAFYTTKGEGMGMGLSICRAIIEAHGGELRAAQNHPSGAVFQFTLPRAASAAASHSASAGP